MCSYLKVPSISHDVPTDKSIIHIPTVAMIYERSLNHVMGIGRRAPWVIPNSNQELRNMLYGCTFITDNPDLL